MAKEDREPEAVQTLTVHELEAESLTLSQQVEALVVEDDAGMEVANALRVAAKQMIKRIEEVLMKPLRDAARGLNQKIRFYGDAMVEPLQDQVERIDAKMGAYYQRQRKARQEAEDKARLEAKRRAEDVQVAAAVQAEQLGLKSLAQKIIERPLDVPPVIVHAPEPPKLQGTATRMDVKWRTVDKAKIPLAFLTEDTVKINAEVREKKLATASLAELIASLKAIIPGIEVYEKPVFIDQPRKQG